LTINYDVVEIVVIDSAFAERHHDPLVAPLAVRFDQPDDCLPHPVRPVTLITRARAIVQRLWCCAGVLREDGSGYGDDVQITCLLF